MIAAKRQRGTFNWQKVMIPQIRWVNRLIVLHAWSYWTLDTKMLNDFFIFLKKKFAYYQDIEIISASALCWSLMCVFWCFSRHKLNNNTHIHAWWWTGKRRAAFWKLTSSHCSYGNFNELYKYLYHGFLRHSISSDCQSLRNPLG